MPENKYKNYASAIKAATDATIGRIKTVLPNVPPGNTLIVNIGANHKNSNHVIAEMDIAQALNDEGICFAVAIEYPENVLDIEISNRYQAADAEKLLSHLRRPEQKQVYAELSALASAITVHEAPVANAALTDIYRKSSTTVFPIDAARTMDFEQIDLGDASTLESVREAAELFGRNLEDYPGSARLTYNDGSMKPVEEKIGLAGRNIHMKKGCKELAQSVEGVRVILLRSGKFHDLDYKGSLSDLCEADDEVAYISVPLYNSSEEKESYAKSRTPRARKALHCVVPCAEEFEARASRVWNGKPEAEHVLEVSRNLNMLREDRERIELGSDAMNVLKSPRELADRLDSRLNAILRTLDPS